MVAGCHSNAVCENIQERFTCTCKKGFMGNGLNCQDINECNTNNGGCHSSALCENNAGSFMCTCRKGFKGDGFSCEDAIPLKTCKTANNGYRLKISDSSFEQCDGHKGSRIHNCPTHTTYAIVKGKFTVLNNGKYFSAFFKTCVDLVESYTKAPSNPVEECEGIANHVGGGSIKLPSPRSKYSRRCVESIACLNQKKKAQASEICGVGTIFDGNQRVCKARSATKYLCPY